MTSSTSELMWHPSQNSDRFQVLTDFNEWEDTIQIKAFSFYMYIAQVTTFFVFSINHWLHIFFLLIHCIVSSACDNYKKVNITYTCTLDVGTLQTKKILQNPNISEISTWIKLLAKIGSLWILLSTICRHHDIFQLFWPQVSEVLSIIRYRDTSKIAGKLCSINNKG